MSTQAAPIGESPWAIDLSEVGKIYKGKIHALKGVQVRVRAGEIFGLLGPNGAGKSTLVKILMTVIRPSVCTGSMLGAPVGDRQTLRRVGYLPEHHRFPSYLTGAQVLDFYAAMNEVERSERKRRIPELLELVGMRDWGGTRVSRYSKGMRQRIGIAQSLMNDPDIVLLDEPTDGVDPVGRRDIRAIVAELKRRGKTVFLNSHMLSELEMVCDRVAILVHGEVARQGTIDELVAGKECYEIELEGPVRQSHLERALPGLAQPEDGPPARAGLPTGEWVEVGGSAIRVGTHEAALVQPIIDNVRAGGGVIRSIRAYRPSLEDLFMEAVANGGATPGAKSPEKKPRGGRRRSTEGAQS